MLPYSVQIHLVNVHTYARTVVPFSGNKEGSRNGENGDQGSSSEIYKFIKLCSVPKYSIVGNEMAGQLARGVLQSIDQLVDETVKSSTSYYDRHF